jgi:hypothetical protein
MCVLVKLVTLGKPVVEYDVSDDPTVGALLEKANVTYKPGCITVDQESVDRDYELCDGDRVYIGDKMKGNTAFTVKIIRLGHSDAIIELPCESGTSIKSLINTLNAEDRAKFYTTEGKDVYEYRINGGEAVSGDAIIPDPSDAALPVRLVMSTRTKGNK